MTLGKLPHIVLTDAPETSLYTTTKSARNEKVSLFRDRIPHGRYLQNQLNLAWQNAEDEQAVSHSSRNGIYLEFKSDSGCELALKSLENLPKRIRLLNVQEKIDITAPNDDGEDIKQTTTYATVFVPHTQKMFFLDRLEQYINDDAPSGEPKNAGLVNSISDIRKALLDSFWSDKADLAPTSDPEWVEVWLSSHETDVLLDFEQLLVLLQIQARDGHIKFPERIVKIIYANKPQLENLTALSDHIAEYRRAKATALYWTELSNHEQAAWVEDLLERCNIDSESQSTVCILDTGVNNGHPLIQHLLSDDDCQAFDPEWGTDDHQHGHGTSMAGIAAYGNLKHALETSEKINLTHRLESVKILPRPPEQNLPNLWGYITSQAIYRAEIQARDKQRIICMAVAAEDTRDQGRPSSWSAALDQLASGADDDTQRLIIVCAGNSTVNISQAANQYPNIQLEDSVHDPAQSWNVLTVGAYTELDQITNHMLEGFTPVASKNCLSPFSTTSTTWEENKWPVKPELVLEGGNLAVDSEGFPTECDDLSLLSIHHDPQQAHFSYFNKCLCTNLLFHGNQFGFPIKLQLLS